MREGVIFTARWVAERGNCRGKLSVPLFVCNVEVSLSYRLKFLENNFTAD